MTIHIGSSAHDQHLSNKPDCNYDILIKCKWTVSQGSVTVMYIHNYVSSTSNIWLYVHGQWSNDILIHYLHKPICRTQNHVSIHNRHKLLVNV